MSQQGTPEINGIEEQVPTVSSDGAVPPAAVKDTLLEESKGFMTAVATFKHKEGPTRRGESFFDTVR